MIQLYDCFYRDSEGRQRCWTTLAKNALHVRLMFNEMVGEGEIIRICLAPDFDF